MTSPARAVANAANAQLSTGPRTEEGKAKSSRNSLKYGLASDQNFIVPGEEEEFEALHQSLIANLAPTDPVEMLEVESILHAAWSLRRVRLIEATLMERGLEALLDEKTAKTLASLQRYGAYHQRMFDSGLRGLRLLRTMRLERTAQAAAAADAEVAQPTRQITKRTQPRPAAALAPVPSNVPHAVDSPVSPELQNEPIAPSVTFGEEAA